MATARSEPFGKLGSQVKQDTHNKDLDAKIIVTSHNSRPGLGKTTLAIRMARDFDKHGWSAEQKGFMSAYEYHNAYDEQPPGSVLLFDEVEGEADNRRSMSSKNVELSQAWAQNRYRNMITICTLPSVSMLDKRLLEMSDYWINVIDRGVAHPYKIYINDFNGQIIRKRLEDNAVISYSDLPDDDPDYQYLKEKKHERRTSLDQQYYSEQEHHEILKRELEDAKMDLRDDLITELYHEHNLSLREIGKLSGIDLSKQRISQIARD